MGLPDGEKFLRIMYNGLHSIPACDRQTDGQTSCHGIVRAMHTRRAVKRIYVFKFLCPITFTYFICF